MERLIDRFVERDAIGPARALIAYLLKHPMAICVATPQQLRFIARAAAMCGQPGFELV